MREFKLITQDGAEPSTQDMLNMVRQELNGMGRNESIQFLIDSMMPDIAKAFDEEQSSEILALVETMFQICTSKWFLEKED